MSGDSPGWYKSGEEIVGQLHSKVIPVTEQQAYGTIGTANPTSRSVFESTLLYHRPLFEDGKFSYEFYYEPGVTMVHPALGRCAFLIEPDAVRIHWLTDGYLDCSGLAPENASDEPGARPGPAALPLKSNAWNRLVLEVKGPSVLLVLNGQPILERRLEPGNRRTVGFFHFADKTGVRVWSVKLEGAWPRAIPRDLLLGGDPGTHPSGRSSPSGRSHWQSP
jgi:hypothetical protein